MTFRVPKSTLLLILTVLGLIPTLSSQALAQPAFGRNIPVTRLPFAPIQQTPITFQPNRFNPQARTLIPFQPIQYPPFNRPAVPYRAPEPRVARNTSRFPKIVDTRTQTPLRDSSSERDLPSPKTEQTRFARYNPNPGRARLRIVQQLRQPVSPAVPTSRGTRIASDEQNRSRFSRIASRPDRPTRLR